MSHRAEQIVVAAAAALRTGTSLQVFENRALSLADFEDLPAACVNLAEDSALEELGIGGLIHSALTLEVTVYAAGTEEPDVRRALMAARRSTHVALMADTRLGLSFVHHVFYGGARAAEIGRAEVYGGSLTTLWRVRYEMNRADPGD